MNFLVFFLALCGTSAETNQRARDLHRFVAARPVIRTLATRPVRAVNDFLVVPADTETAPFDDPADLEGMSFLFTPSGAGFHVRRDPLLYDSDVGPLFDFGRDTTRALSLGFEFPFGDTTYSTATLSVMRGIHFTDRPSLPSRNFAAFEPLTSATPLISPLLDHFGSPGIRADVFIRQTADAVTITWRSQSPGFVAYDIQAVLHRSGAIRFAYAQVRNVAWGGVVVTTGNPSSAQTAPIAAFDDPAGDVGAIFGPSRDMLDVTRVELARVDGTSMLEVKIEVAAPIDREVLHGDANYSFTLDDSLNRVEIFVRPDQIVYRVPNVGELIDAAVTISGSAMTFYLDEELLALPSRKVRGWVHTNAFQPADVLEMDIDLGGLARSAETDLSQVTEIEAVSIVETFTVPTVNVHGVWDRLQAERGYRTDEIDVVFVYSSFLSDLIYKPYGAFALYANPGADGVSAHSSKNSPRTPTLVNMNRLGAFGDYDTDVLIHEFGHRWLYYFSIVEDGGTTHSLNPLGNHPAGFVHTPGAFNVNTSADSSTMGGATFSVLGDRQFRSPPAGGDWSAAFSWHELYLMGLARPEEVTPWWYIRDSDPPLPLEYYPPSNVTVTGTRVDVGLQSIVDAMGPRDPSFDESQKGFRALFVVLERESEPLSSDALDRQYRIRFEKAFDRATGGRGGVRTSLSQRRRVVSR